MKATLEYILPEDNTEFRWARNGYEYWAELRDIRKEIMELYNIADAGSAIDSLYERFIVNSTIDMDM